MSFSTLSAAPIAPPRPPWSKCSFTPAVKHPGGPTNTHEALALLVTLGAWLLQACSAQTTAATQPITWDGEWLSRAVNEYTTLSCAISLTTSGKAINGNFDCAEGFITGTLTGTISEDLLSVSGTLQSSIDDNPETFEWHRNTDNIGQFVGNHDGTYEWCGAREGIPLPDPCFGP